VQLQYEVRPVRSRRRHRVTADPNAIDERHRNWLREVLLNGEYRRVLEVGSWKGFSAAAFFDALTEGKVEEVHLCDSRPQPELEAAVRRHPLRDRITLHRTPSVDLLGRDADWDFTFIDGNHSARVVGAELNLLLPMRLRVVAFHDTSSCGRYEGCDGPQWAKRAYQRAGYFCIEDSVFRPDERTERGLTVCCRELDDYAVAYEAYCKWC
jgi:hypothetical protein